MTESAPLAQGQGQKRLARKIGVIGSGSWGTAVTRLVSPQADDVVLWSYEPAVARGINENHHNPVQLPDFELAANVRAT
ncbi:MAG: hypothetical protein J6S63_01515, partial [Atopobiaceae bacterium]|nr:hypothetical protein [Atopobiaceae bacterium]